MLVGVPREIRNHEYRVGLTPESVRELVQQGHRVVVEQGAGQGIAADDDAYLEAGAQIAESGAEVYAQADLIVKVKEPQKGERAHLRPDQVLFAYLHLAADGEQTQDLCNSGAACIAYETVQDTDGALPLLAPMSEVAGRMSVQAGAHCLERSSGGRGLLLAGVPGLEPARVLILGGGTVGANAALIALGMGGDVTVMDRSPEVLRRLDRQFQGRVKTVLVSVSALQRLVQDADLVIGAALVAGGKAPRLVTRAMVASMRPGSVIVDVAIDQGGCCETSRPTTHAQPTYVEEGVVHYCVSNMPGAVPTTSVGALNAAILPHVLALANKGWKQALRDDSALRKGLNVYGGQVFCPAVAKAQNLALADIHSLLD